MLSVKRILCVEDHADTCDLLTFMLGKEGYTAECAATLGETLTHPGRFDLYVIDHGLPDGDGFELCRAIRKRHPNARVVIYSGHAHQRPAPLSLTPPRQPARDWTDVRPGGRTTPPGTEPLRVGAAVETVPG